MLDLKIEGLDKLQQIFRAAPADIRKSLDVCIDIVGEMIKVEAYRLARKRTGTMARSIYHKKVTELIHEIGAMVFYAVFQEFGTSRMPPHSFLRPAIEKYKPQIQRVFRDKMDEWLRRRGD